MPTPPNDPLAEHPIGPDSPPKAARRPETLSLFPDIGEMPLGREAAPSATRRPRSPSLQEAARSEAASPLATAPEEAAGPVGAKVEVAVSFARRVVAGLADLLILALVGAVELAAGAFFLDLRFPPAALLWIAAFLALVALVLLVLVPFVWGTTPGMALADLKVVADDGGSPTLLASFLRFAGFVLTGLLAGVPMLVAAFDRRGRTLADLFSGTSLVAVRRETVLERAG
ncbi:MAG TPA: RDD family protein [Thermoanaerobaculia bacterium]